MLPYKKNPFETQNLYGGYAATGYGSNPALTAARTAAFREQEAEKNRISLRQKEEEKLKKEELENKELEKAGTPAKYRDSRGTPFDKYTIAKINAGLYSTEPPPRPRYSQGLNKFDDPEEWAKRSAEASESAGLYSEKGRMATQAMNDREKEQRRRAMLANSGNQGNPSAVSGGIGGGGMQSIGQKSFGMDPMMQLAAVGQQFRQQSQMGGVQPITPTQTSSMLQPSNFQPTYSQPTDSQPTNFQPQMDALRSGIMGRMAGRFGVQLPQMGQPFKPKYTPYWQQTGMNPPKFPSR